MTLLICTALIPLARHIRDKTSHSQATSILSCTRDVVKSAELPRIEGQNDNSRCRLMQHGSLPNQKNVPRWTEGSQQVTTASHRVEDATLHRIGAQFEDNQLSPIAAQMTNNLRGGTIRHQYHQTSLHYVDTLRGTFQASEMSSLHPMERFLLETSAEQPANFFQPSAGQLSANRGYFRRSIPSAK